MHVDLEAVVGESMNIETACSHGTWRNQKVFYLRSGNDLQEDEENSGQESMFPQSIFVVPRGSFGRDVSHNYTYSSCAVTIVGGLGALGACVSSWFAGTRFEKIYNRASRDIALLGRSGRSKGWPPAVHFSCCGSISIQRFDVASRFPVLFDISTFTGSHSSGFALQQSDPVDRIFIHASGVLNDRIFPRQNLATFREVCSAKLSFPDISTLRNHAGPRQVECVFSSIAAILANQGQMAYVAANNELDTRTLIANQAGTPAISVRWGAWGEVGMAAEAYDTKKQVKCDVVCRNLLKFGVKTLSPEQGIAALAVVLRQRHAIVMVASMDWAQVYRIRPDLRAMLTEVRDETAREEDTSFFSTTTENNFNNKTKESNKVITVSACDNIEHYVLKAATEVIGYEPVRDLPLMAAGLDSLGITELCSAIATYTGKEISTATFFNHPSVAALSIFLASTDQDENESMSIKEISSRDTSRKGRCDSTEPLSSWSTQYNRDDLKQPMATGIFSSHGRTVTGFEPTYINENHTTKLISSSREPSIPPITRWDVEWIDAASGILSTVSTRFGAFLGDIDLFDAKVFGMRSGEARRVDPQQRLLLESTLMSKMLAEAGNGTRLKESNVAVAVGVQHIEYALLDCNENQSVVNNVKDDPYVATGSALSVAAGRVAYVFNFGLAALSIDTACSASLMAVHLAVSGALHLHSSNQISSDAWSTCAGVNLTIGHAHFATIKAAGMLSSDGRCKVLEKSADGYGRAEAVATFMLKHHVRLDTQRSDNIGCSALFNVDASAANQDGRSSSLTAPNGLAQQMVITIAHTKAHTALIAHPDVSMGGVSMHGTGTTLGDPIELNSLISALSRQQKSLDMCISPLVLAASKSHAGHSEAAAGAVALLRVDEEFASRRIAMLNYLRILSPYLVTELRGRQTKCEIFIPRNTSGCGCQHASGFARVGISGFAFSGSNVHIATSSTSANEAMLHQVHDARKAYKVIFEKEQHWSLKGPRGGVLAVARMRHCTCPQTHDETYEAYFASPPGWIPSNGSIEQPVSFPLVWLGACAQIAHLAVPLNNNNVFLAGSVVPAERIIEMKNTNTFHINVNILSGLIEAGTQSGQIIAKSSVHFAHLMTCACLACLVATQRKYQGIIQKINTMSFRDVFVAELAIPKNPYNDCGTWTAAAIHAANDIVTAQQRKVELNSCLTLDTYTLFQRDLPASPSTGLKNNTDCVQIHGAVYQRSIVVQKYLCTATVACEPRGFADVTLLPHHKSIANTTCDNHSISDLNDMEATTTLIIGSRAKNHPKPTLQNNILERILDAVEEVAGVPVHSNEYLTNVGIDSIAAVELATMLQSSMGITLDIPEIASAPTATVIFERIVTTIELSKIGGERQSAAAGFIEPPVTESAACSEIQCQPVFPDLSSTDMLIKSLKPESNAHPSLFLGAPAFGDGQIAYMRLVSELQLGRHPVHTLERDVAARPWPEVATAHARMINSSQPEGCIAVGGHSLGGVLAVESAMTLEFEFDREAICILFDAPHPVQFKSEWNDIRTPGSSAATSRGPEIQQNDIRRPQQLQDSTGLAYMEVALASFHYDTGVAGWSSMSRDEKYSLFEAVTFQALGRRIDAKLMDEEISAGPYANQWNSGIIHSRNSGQMDMSSWQLVCGHPESSALCRLRSKVFTYKAGEENDALFATDVMMNNQPDEKRNVDPLVCEPNLFGTSPSVCLQSIGGYAWVLACDNVEVVHCQGNHMNILTTMTDGGDLEDTIIPHLSAELNSVWNDVDVHDISCTSKRDVLKPFVSLERNKHSFSSLTASCIHSVLKSVTAEEDKADEHFLEYAWAVDEWHLPKHSLPLWKQVGVRIVSTFKSRDDCCDNGHCRVEPEVKIPNLDACVGRVILGLNEKSWSLTRGQASDCASCERPNVVHHSPPVVIVFIQDLMEGIERWSPAALKATVPVIGIHLPSRLLAGHSSCSENASTDYKDDQTGRQIHIREEHAAAVVLASVRATLLTEFQQKNISGITFAALYDTPAARVAFNAAVQCRMRGDIDAAAFTFGSTEKADIDERWFDFFGVSDDTHKYGALYQMSAAKYAEQHTAKYNLFIQQRHDVNTKCMTVAERPGEITPLEWDAALSAEVSSFDSLLKKVKDSFRHFNMS